MAASSSTQQNSEVQGIVQSVEPKKKILGQWSPAKFVVLAPNSGITIECQYKGYCDVRKGDSIYLKGKAVPLGEKRFSMTPVEVPIVVPGVSKSVIVEEFIRAFPRRRLSSVKFSQLFDHLLDQTKNDPDLNEEEYQADQKVNLLMTKLCNTVPRSQEILNIFYPILKEDDANKLLNHWYDKREMRKLYMLGLSKSEIVKSRIKTDILYIKARENPYTIPTVSMEKCRSLLIKLGKKGDFSKWERRGAILRFVYQRVKVNAWTGVPLGVLRRSYPSLDKDLEALTAVIDPDGNTPGGYGLILDTVGAGEKVIYLSFNHKVESELAKMFSDRIGSNKHAGIEVSYKCPTLSEDQEAAIDGVLNYPVTGITGGPGSGKTMCITEIVHNFQLRNIKFVICCFTGIAVSVVVKEMDKYGVVCADKCMTLHRANAKGHLLVSEDVTHLIVDEGSMVAAPLLHKFLSHNPQIKNIIMVGDCNQLLPIEWGSIFKEVITSKRCPLYRLKHEHRSYKIKGEKDYASAAVNLIANYKPDSGLALTLETGPNFRVFKGDLSDVKVMIDRFRVARKKDHQVVCLTPYNRDKEEINQYCQGIFRKNDDYVLDSRRRKWHLNDIVMMLENNYDINVMNGEIGRVTAIDISHITVDFAHRNSALRRDQYNFDLKVKSIRGEDDEEYTGKKDLTVGSLSLAYSLTIHKAQGSGFDFVILYLPNNRGRSNFINRNLVMTAISRKKRACYCVCEGGIKQLEKYCTTLPPFRADYISDRLADQLPEVNVGYDGRSLTVGIYGDPDDPEVGAYFDDFIPD